MPFSGETARDEMRTIADLNFHISLYINIPITQNVGKTFRCSRTIHNENRIKKDNRRHKTNKMALENDKLRLSNLHRSIDIK